MWRIDSKGVTFTDWFVWYYSSYSGRIGLELGSSLWITGYTRLTTMDRILPTTAGSTTHLSTKIFRTHSGTSNTYTQFTSLSAISQQSLMAMLSRVIPFSAFTPSLQRHLRSCLLPIFSKKWLNSSLSPRRKRSITSKVLVLSNVF